MGRRKGEVIIKKLLTNYFHSYPIGQNLLTWLQIAARESGKCSLLVMFQSKNYISKQNSNKTNKHMPQECTQETPDDRKFCRTNNPTFVRLAMPPVLWDLTSQSGIERGCDSESVQSSTLDHQRIP